MLPRRSFFECLRIAGVAVLLSLCAAVAPAADNLDIARLMQALAQVKAGEATFTERRHVALLEQTLESSGKLSFSAPDTFIRETLKPRRERMAIVGNTLTMSQGERTRTMALDSAPGASLIVDAMRGTLTGNRETLERTFDARVSGDLKMWFMELVPRDSQLRSHVLSIRIAGQHGVVREVLVALPDGDRSVMTIDPMVAAAKPAARPAGTTPP
jgi:hypothetical protein